MYVWTNPVRPTKQDGAVFVWTWKGRAEVLGTFFSFPGRNDQRDVWHELQSLSLAVLDVNRPPPHEWTPEAPGIDLTAIERRASAGEAGPAAFAPDARADARLLGHDRRQAGETMGAALLPQPLYRYDSTDPDVIDGAVFSLVTSAGTDPEALVVLEARKPPLNAKGGAAWHFGVARFTDLNIWIRHKGKVVYTGKYLPYGMNRQDPKHRYRVLHDRSIAPVDGADR